MAANSAIKVTSIDFDTIKTNLKTYLASQGEFKDYDFEGSSMSVLLDLMSYNTYYQSIYTNMVANEMFLDSAQIRNNIVSRAKMLGYTPRSAQGSTATVRLNITPSASPTPDSITVAKNTTFTSTIDGTDYTFVTPDQTTINSNNGVFAATVNIKEGTPITHRFTVSTSNPVKYILPNENIETDSIAVQVQVSSSNTTANVYSKATNITTVDNNSPVYYIQENNDGKYELTFGDGILGNKLKDGNIVIADYRVVTGADTNGANNFISPDTIAGESNFTATLVTSASGGAAKETDESIKFNAPKNLQAQNRAVTTNDYKTIILAENGDVQNVSVWGGEQNDPPIYGKVFIAGKPVTGDTISSTRKTEIINSLVDRQVQSIEAEMVDPTYLYIVPTIQAYFDPARTILSSGELLTKIKNSVINFETRTLNNFKTTFLYSQLVRSIDNTDDSITDNATKIQIMMKVNHSIGSATTYTLLFNNAFSLPHEGHLGTISSNAFTLDGQTQYFDDDGLGNLRTYYFSGTGSKVVTNPTAGTVDYESGRIQLLSFNPTAISGDVLKIKGVPNSTRVIPIRAQIPLIADTSITMIRSDTLATQDSFTGSLTVGDTTISSTALSSVYY